MADTVTAPAYEKREDNLDSPSIEGVRVREDDIESVKGIRAIAWLFRGMAVLMLLLMAVQVTSAVTNTVTLSIGVVVAEAIRLVIFAGLLWGTGDLAVLWIKSHYDIRASRILLARLEYTVRELSEAGRVAVERDGPHVDRGR